MPPDSQNDQIPAIRTFQRDQSAFGELPSSVNLFRGDINATQKLFSMPGRTPGDGLDVTLTLLYQSNVYQDAMIWNLDAPTGTLGLGWGLPLTAIRLDDGGGPTPGTRTHSYSSQGAATALVQEPSTPFLFSMDSLPSRLNSVTVRWCRLPLSRFSPAMVSAFLPRQRSAPCRLRPGPGSWWTTPISSSSILHSMFRHSMPRMAASPTNSSTTNFEDPLLSAIRAVEVIVEEAGQRYSFGGIAPVTSQGYATILRGNSIMWSVNWQTGDQTAIWIGPSTIISGQGQHAQAWALAATTTPWGDAVGYRYNDWPRGGDGLIPIVEQLVGGADGLPLYQSLLPDRHNRCV